MCKLCKTVYGDSGQLRDTHLLQTLACNKQLTYRARAVNLQEFISQRLDLGRSVPDHTLANTVEAVLGAVWLDSNNSIPEVENAMNKLSIYQDEEEILFSPPQGS